jgi:phospholipid/cholesterol/gamma-HCH transport system permease protein
MGLSHFTLLRRIMRNNCLAEIRISFVIRDIFNSLLDFVRTFGAFQLFFLRMLQHAPSILTRRFGLVVKQVYNTGALSIVIIMVCGFFVGGVLALQGYSNLARFNAEDSVGTFAAFALIKELGPVITALLFAGRAGTALASEIGLMKATDQLAAMEMMAVNPMRRILVPRFLGGVISMPLLAAIFSTIGMFGAHVVGVNLLGVDVGAFWQQIQQTLEPSDIYEGIFKSFVFGVIASLLAVWEGYNTIPTAEGVGRATTRTVVITAIGVLFFDFIITASLL